MIFWHTALLFRILPLEVPFNLKHGWRRQTSASGMTVLLGVHGACGSGYRALPASYIEYKQIVVHAYTDYGCTHITKTVELGSENTFRFSYYYLSDHNANSDLTTIKKRDLQASKVETSPRLSGGCKIRILPASTFVVGGR